MKEQMGEIGRRQMKGEEGGRLSCKPVAMCACLAFLFPWAFQVINEYLFNVPLIMIIIIKVSRKLCAPLRWSKHKADSSS